MTTNCTRIVCFGRNGDRTNSLCFAFGIRRARQNVAWLPIARCRIAAAELDVGAVVAAAAAGS